MGCSCAPMYMPPEDPSVQVYAPVTNFLCHSDARTRAVFGGGSGLAYISGDVFVFRPQSGRRQLSLPLRDIQKVSLERAFRDKCFYHLPCYCCTCRGCPDGIVDIRATVDGVGMHMGLSMADAEEFMEKLQSHVSNANMNKY